MPTPERARRSPFEWFFLRLGSLAVLFWGGAARQEQRFARRLLERYPALSELPPDELQQIAWRVTSRFRLFHITVFSLAAAAAAGYLTTPLFIAIHWAGMRIPMPVKVLVVMLACWCAWQITRRMLIERQLARAVSRAYPQLFCVGCGYCLLGLEASSPCPECGGVRTSLSDRGPGKDRGVPPVKSGVLLRLFGPPRG